MSSQAINGFILTSHWDENPSPQVTLFGVSDQIGAFQLNFINEKFVVFVAQASDLSNCSVKYELKTLKMKSFDKNGVDAVYLKRSKDFFAFKQFCSENGVRTFENDIWPNDRFLMERFINGTLSFQGAGQLNGNVTVFNNPIVKATNTDQKFSVLSVDIETGTKGQLYSIGVHYSGKHSFKYVYMLGETSQEHDGLSILTSETDVIQAFLKTFFKFDPDIIIGWHVIGFDMKFLINKCAKLRIPFNLGRDGSSIDVDERKGVGFFAKIRGRVIIDGPPALRSAFYQFKNFKLDTVASEVLGIGKDITSGAGKVDEIERRFKEDKIALAKYNLLDCTLVTDIYDKLNIIDFYIERTKISGLLIDRLGISTAAFDHQYLPLLHREGFVAPNSTDITREESSSGGLVIEPKVGLHKNVAVFDFKSLYPSVIRTFRIDPMARLESDIDTVTNPAGIEFSKSRHILPNIILNLLGKRQVAKDEKNSSLSMAIKILMNSFYGVMGSYRCRFYHSDLPWAITQTGHWILKQSIEFFENRRLEVLYGDTDSLFIKFPDDARNLKEDADKLKEELNTFLRTVISEEFKLTSYLDLEFEKVFDQIFFTSTRDGAAGAKKRYVGVCEGDMQFIGMEYVRSDWTSLAKKFQFNLYEKLFLDMPVEIYIKEFIAQLKKQEYDEHLIYTKRLSKDPLEYTKNIPPHVKAALLIDHKGPYRLKEVSYIITVNGPVPYLEDITDLSTLQIDYEHYIEKQVKPIAEQVLNYMNLTFDGLQLGSQLTFF